MGSVWTRLFPALWMRWAISIIVGVAVIAALVVFVDHNNSNSEAKTSSKALEREYRYAQAVIGAEQAPHTIAVAHGQSAPGTFVTVVRADMRHRIKTGNVSGRLQKVRCRASGAQAGREAYRCTAEAGDVNYPYVGVFTKASKHITYCQRDAPPIPTERIPVSARCTL
ncbi:MAG: hypothetical protein WAL22_05270 [Solirubrobacteraceae bacterium]